MTTLQEVIDEKEKQKKRVLPTPSEGWPVVWYEANNRANPRSARVYRVEASGKLTLYVDGFAAPKQGVWHVSAPVHDNPNSIETHRCGSWDFPKYLVDQKLFNKMCERHAEEIENKLLSLYSELEKQQAKEVAAAT